MKSFIIVLFLLLASCGYKQVSYQTSNWYSVNASVEIVEQFLRENLPSKSNLLNVEVNNKFFKLETTTVKKTKFLFINKGITSIDNVSYVYFNSIADIKLFHKGQWMVVFYDSANRAIFKTHTHREDKANQFIDAVSSLAKHSTKE